MLVLWWWWWLVDAGRFGQVQDLGWGWRRSVRGGLASRGEGGLAFGVFRDGQAAVDIGWYMESDPAVAVVMVVTLNEGVHKLPGVLERAEPVGRTGAVLQGFEPDGFGAAQGAQERKHLLADGLEHYVWVGVLERAPAQVLLPGQEDRILDGAGDAALALSQLLQHFEASDKQQIGDLLDDLQRIADSA